MGQYDFPRFIIRGPGIGTVSFGKTLETITMHWQSCASMKSEERHGKQPLCSYSYGSNGFLIEGSAGMQQRGSVITS